MSLNAELTAEVDALRVWGDTTRLPRAGGPLLGSGVLRVEPSDFFVREYSGMELRGDGEHVYVQVRKTGQNTRWVAKRLAEFAGIPYKSVSYAGLKDRHAIAEQCFSLHMPGASDPDWSALQLPGVEVLSCQRHDRKLRQGQLSYNHFRLRVRECEIKDTPALEQRLQSIAARGIPNYFGAQRFGRNLDNLGLILQESELRRLPRESRGFAISSLRAAMFNGYLAERIAAASWREVLPGEALLSDRPRGVAEADVSAFRPERLAAAVLWGKGMGGTGDVVRELERAWFGRFPQVCAALERAGARMSRRVMCACVAKLQWRYDARQQVFELEFMLGPGVFATTLLNEIIATEDRALTLMEDLE